MIGVGVTLEWSTAGKNTMQVSGMVTSWFVAFLV